ncbi:hypothetical protein, partial [Klebsiella variicola]|uniref:hypothetical protein n=1 Tax=Klebsiella variicola TaxID=244366 RepID=UPI0013D58088
DAASPQEVFQNFIEEACGDLVNTVDCIWVKTNDGNVTHIRKAALVGIGNAVCHHEWNIPTFSFNDLTAAPFS